MNFSGSVVRMCVAIANRKLNSSRKVDTIVASIHITHNPVVDHRLKFIGRFDLSVFNGVSVVIRLLLLLHWREECSNILYSSYK